MTLDKSVSFGDSSEPLSTRLHKSKGTTFFLWSVAFTAALTALHFGYVISNINVPANIFANCGKFSEGRLESELTRFGLKACFQVSSGMWGLVGSGVPLGGWIGSLTGGILVKKFGLRRAILMLNVPLFVGYAAMGLANNLALLVFGRLLQGFACGASGAMIPLYLSLVTPIRARGLFTNFFQLLLVSGILLSEVISYRMDYGRKLWFWRFGFSGGILITAVQLLMARFGFLPETPNDLDDSGKHSEARLLRGSLGIDSELGVNLKDSNSNSSLPKSEILENIETDSSLMNLITFRIPAAKKSLLLGILLHAGQQVSGVNAVFFYSASILSGGKSQNFDEPLSLNPIILSFINVLMTVVAIWLLGRTGRRPVALVSIAGSAVCLFLLSASFQLFPTLSVIPLVSFVAFFAVGLGPIPWLMMPEIFPQNWSLTMSAISVCVSINWIVNILVTAVFPYLNQHIGKEYIFGAFGLSCAALFLATFYILPETKNRPASFIK